MLDNPKIKNFLNEKTGFVDLLLFYVKVCNNYDFFKFFPDTTEQQMDTAKRNVSNAYKLIGVPESHFEYEHLMKFLNEDFLTSVKNNFREYEFFSNWKKLIEMETEYYYLHENDEDIADAMKEDIFKLKEKLGINENVKSKDFAFFKIPQITMDFVELSKEKEIGSRIKIKKEYIDKRLNAELIKSIPTDSTDAREIDEANSIRMSEINSDALKIFGDPESELKPVKIELPKIETVAEPESKKQPQVIQISLFDTIDKFNTVKNTVANNSASHHCK